MTSYTVELLDRPIDRANQHATARNLGCHVDFNRLLGELRQWSAPSQPDDNATIMDDRNDSSIHPSLGSLKGSLVG